MKIKRAVITAAAPDQRMLALQNLIDRDGRTKSALAIIMEEAIAAGIESIAVVVHPGDENAYRAGVGPVDAEVDFLPQCDPNGYGQALLAARGFVRDEPFLHLVGDHLAISHAAARCAQELVEVAGRESCCVSAVQATRETLLQFYGTVGGRPVSGQPRLYEVERIMEKPTPTQAEQALIVPGLRTGHYLCFFGMHVLTPHVLDTLQQQAAALAPGRMLQLSPALAAVAGRERYLALEVRGLRYNLGVRYGLFLAQMALILQGKDRENVLAQMVELLAARERER